MTFGKNCDLEKHLTEIHEAEKKYKCKKCDKLFFLQWRCKQHMKMHTSDIKYCHYYNNLKDCHYDEIGCMFLTETP